MPAKQVDDGELRGDDRWATVAKATDNREQKWWTEVVFYAARVKQVEPRWGKAYNTVDKGPCYDSILAE